ncbi:sugar phosphate isomerase/epimerase [Paenibacillus sp. JX-17]|uniref:Sugar phosphate isomerase/epimerase n=1 Tax=Paenibacillus lacisoli TaxID=3064525 RepID=A0ABT9CMK7_9BACL|nr:sugar phosphate isomerase/epimerase [Paenibacillus sp. JX-17]MDO7908833.1 sugar phosphate isomerase/epimerase [Paenibacillus sp. JX-17]
MAISAGLNVYSVAHELAADYFGTLKKLAAAGYANLELIGFNIIKGTSFLDEHTPESVKSRLDELGLFAVAAHEGVAPGKEIVAHDWRRVMQYYEVLDCRRIVIPSIWIENREQALQAADQLNKVGQHLGEHGFQLYLHNHAHEFRRVEEGAEQTLFDLVVAHTDPQQVRFELDLAWVMRGGADPLQVLTRLAGRCDMIHQKDINRGLAGSLNLLAHREGDVPEDRNEPASLRSVYRDRNRPDDFVDLGTGLMNLEAAYDQIRKWGHVRYALVENESASTDKLKSVENDLRVLQSYL